MPKYRIVRRYWEEKDKFVYVVQRERLVSNKLLPFLKRQDWLNIDNNGRVYEKFIGGWDDIAEATDHIERIKEKDIKRELSGAVVYEN